MRASRIVTATFAAAGIVIAAANPGCSSSQGSGFLLDASPDGTTLDGSVRDGAKDGAHDGKVRDTGVDSPMKLGMPDSSKTEAATFNEGGFNDARPDVSGDATCVLDAGATGPGPVQHICIIYGPGGVDDGNECDGHHDPPAPYPSNGTTGNGFDDNCNGLVDEGCSCTNVGSTKDCYLVPSQQTVKGLPVGWCAQNSKGTEVCSQHGESGATWSGQCRGAQQPYANDFCAPGDFNCDGKQENPTGENCACNQAPVQCPTDAVTTAPYPPVHALPLKIDAAPWFTNQADVAMATDWTWTLSGGDCDNILPHPTFGIFPTNDAALPIHPVGTEVDTLGTSMKEHGYVANATQLTTATPAGVASAVYPAFSLSGDYLLEASWTLMGKPYSCTVKVQVRAPGLRAEGCWSTEGLDDDLDLHMAKINDFPQCPTTHAWSNSGCNNEDCFYGNCYSAGFGGGGVDWGYPSSPASACTGWGSQGTGTVCNNPRLDRDANGESGECNSALTDPAFPKFCGPENINVDYPMDNDRFAVGLRFFGEDGDNPSPALSHVNVYCNGARIVSAGYDPTTGNNFPALLTQGGDSTGDMWKVGIVTTHVTGAGLTCDFDTTQSAHPHLDRDGSTAYCVDNSDLDGATSQSLLMTTGQEPANADTLCYH